MASLIYAYKKITENKIVYVGQTVQLETRHKQHMIYDPWNENTKEYNYPLSRGVRKYGVEEYELIILEDNIPLEDLDNREQYWIKFYDTYWNGYNQTIGGTFPTKPIYHDDVINLTVEMLKDEAYSYEDISQKTGLSYTHIYNINIGERRYNPNLEYPIRKIGAKGSRGIKFNQEEIVNIHKDLLNSNLDYNALGKKYDCCKATIYKINKGILKAYKLDNYNYPIRKNARSISKKYYWENK